MATFSIKVAPTTAYLGLGSNLDNPITQVKNALRLLQAHPTIHWIAHSSFYLTKPVGYLDQPDFVNAVAAIQTTLVAHDLLQILLDIETKMGRIRTFQNAPRIIDIDILWYQDQILHDLTLTLPHPRLVERAFMLIPLAELAPDLWISPYGAIQTLLSHVQCESVRKRLDYLKNDGF